MGAHLRFANRMEIPTGQRRPPAAGRFPVAFLLLAVCCRFAWIGPRHGIWGGELFSAARAHLKNYRLITD
jgi:hypothetical protein